MPENAKTALFYVILCISLHHSLLIADTQSEVFNH